MTNATMNSCCSADFSAAAPVRTGLLARIAAFRTWLEQAQSVSKQRQALSQLSAEQLDDIGLDLDAASREAARPFWDFS